MMSSSLVKPKMTMIMVLKQFPKICRSESHTEQSKCEFNKQSISFFGFVFSEKGISPDPMKVESIEKAFPPTTTHAVRSFLGMGTCFAKFIPHFSDVSEPLRKLMKKDQPFL